LTLLQKSLCPNWVNENTIAGEKSKAKWKRFWNNLYVHEQGHWDIAVQHAEKSKEWAQNKEGCIYIVEVCCGNDTQKAKQEARKLATDWSQELEKKMNEELAKIGADLQMAEQQYDVKTNHGATQGAVLINTFRLHQ
jgi:predicted secreted Zn-dependent protease